MNKKVYALVNMDNVLRGIYSSKIELSKGVDYWINKYPNEVLAFYEHELDYSPEPLGWDWCYIPLNSSVDELSAYGAMVPLQSFWGKNISEGNWNPIPDLNE